MPAANNAPGTGRRLNRSTSVALDLEQTARAALAGKEKVAVSGESGGDEGTTFTTRHVGELVGFNHVQRLIEHGDRVSVGNRK
jgi:hypothetical protein